jgi:hypothetical protein
MGASFRRRAETAGALIRLGERSEAIQTGLPMTLDCFASLAMTA